MKFGISLILVVLLASSCRKKDLDVPFKDLKGDFEWFYSDNGAAFDVAGYQYGIRITKNGRLKIYKDAELQENYRVFATVVSDDGKTQVYANKGVDQILYTMSNDTLSTVSYPYEGAINYYVKTK